MSKSAMQELKCLIKDRIKNLNNELNYYTSGYKQGLIEMEIEVDALLEQEKEQIEDAYCSGYQHGSTLEIIQSEEYYNETYQN